MTPGTSASARPSSVLRPAGYSCRQLRVRIREPHVQVAIVAVAWSSPVPRRRRIVKAVSKPVSRGYATASIRS
jgi:hypothetical protein